MKHRHQIRTREKSALIKKLVEDNPRIESRKLARLLMSTHGALFPNLESARSAVRKARGAEGEIKRKTCKVVGRTPTPAEVLRLPSAREIPSDPHVINPGTTLILCDVHLPFHDRAAVEAAVKMAKGRRIDTILLGGDLADFFSISRFLTNPAERDLPGELKTIAEFLGWLRAKFRNAEIVWKLGNHEERWAHYLWTKAPEICGLPTMKIGNITGADNLGVTIVDDRLPVQMGHLAFLHGHELTQGAASPVNPARGLFIRVVSTSAMGHQHRTSEHAEKVGIGDGRFITCWSIACLCGLSPMFMRVNKWNHGFAINQHRADGSFNFDNKRIHDGKVL